MGAGGGSEDIQYSEKYFDSVFEYRHVILPSDIARLVPRTHLLTETEWRNLGVQQSPGWINYMSHLPEPHILLFRRLRTIDAPEGTVDRQEAINRHVEHVNKLRAPPQDMFQSKLTGIF